MTNTCVCIVDIIKQKKRKNMYGKNICTKNFMGILSPENQRAQPAPYINFVRTLRNLLSPYSVEESLSKYGFFQNIFPAKISHVKRLLKTPLPENCIFHKCPLKPVFEIWIPLFGYVFHLPPQTLDARTKPSHGNQLAEKATRQKELETARRKNIIYRPSRQGFSLGERGLPKRFGGLCKEPRFLKTAFSKKL